MTTETIAAADIAPAVKEEIKEEVAAKPTKKAPRRRKPKNYINNADLLIQLEKSHEIDGMSPDLVLMFRELCKRYATKGNFINYPYNDDMQAYAMMMLVRSWFKFDKEKSQNPFAFFTQCVKNSFRQYLNQEKKQRNIRDELLVKSGLTPSYTYQLANQSNTPSDGGTPSGDCDVYESTDAVPVSDYDGVADDQ